MPGSRQQAIVFFRHVRHFTPRPSIAGTFPPLRCEPVCQEMREPPEPGTKANPVSQAHYRMTHHKRALRSYLRQDGFTIHGVWYERQITVKKTNPGRLRRPGRAAVP